MRPVSLDLKLFDIANFYGPLMGVLELYNMGLRINSPIVGWFEELSSAETLDDSKVLSIPKSSYACFLFCSR